MKSKTLFRIHFFIGLLVFLSLSRSLLAQPVLAVKPDDIRFKSRFEGFQRISFFNQGNRYLLIDSIRYGYDRYFFRFNKNPGAKIIIAAHDSLGMDCYLLPFVQIPTADVNDTLLVYSNSAPDPFRVNIHIDFSEPDLGRGTIKGAVLTASPNSHANVYFFFNGKYLTDSVLVSPSGQFSKDLPQGDYVVGAKTDSSYLTFFPNTTNILEAKPVSVGKDDAVPITITPVKYSASTYSISGSIIDSITSTPASKGLVIIKSGTHTPGVSKVSSSDTLTAFTYFISSGGTYVADQLPHSGYYYAMALCDYFLPSYYTRDQQSAPFWAQADSLDISGPLSNANIYVTRDSAYGNGVLSGTLQAVSGNVAGAIIYAKSTNNNKIYLSGSCADDGTFTLYDLPFGSYTLIVQRFGYKDYVSTNFNIDSVNPTHKNIQINTTAGIVSTPSGKTYLLLNNYPNPFNPSTTVAYTLPYETDIELTVYNALGQKITDLVKAHQPAGSYRVAFVLGAKPSGIYFIRLKTLSEQKIIKAVAVK